MKIVIKLDESKAEPVLKILQGLKEAGLIQHFRRGRKDRVSAPLEANARTASPVQPEQTTSDIAERYRDLVD